MGRIHRIKGIDILVRAFANIIKKLDDVRLVVGPDDGYLRELKVLIKALKIEDKVLITGPLYGKSKLEVYVDVEVYVLPSRYETFPMSVLEAYGCGKPVIASNVGGVRELVLNGQTGILFKAGNIKQLAESILCLLNEEYKAVKMGKNGRRFVEESFQIERIVNKLEKVYEEIVGDG